MYFQHSDQIWADYPELTAGVIMAAGIDAEASVDAPVARFSALAEARLATATEAEFPEIQAWRRAFGRMGLKPTQYRCASEALLRRFRKERHLPRIHPLVDLCNAASLGYGIPVAALDLARVSEHLEVRYAGGHERYQTFSGGTEHPDRGEVIFADAAAHAHARRWTNRQSGQSAVRDATSEVLIVAEGMHQSASADVPRLVAALAAELSAIWPAAPKTATLRSSAPRFEW